MSAPDTGTRAAPGDGGTPTLTTIRGPLGAATARDLRDRVAAATDPARLAGDDPYHATFWYDLDAPPRNPVETAVRDRLRPVLPLDGPEIPVGVEWWLGRLSSPFATSFEFGVHRDYGEHPTSGALTNPLRSSVLYLNTLDDGPLVVFRDAPDLTPGAFEHVMPREDTFAVFPGHLWHAVLGRADVGAGPGGAGPVPDRLTVVVNWWTFRPSGETEPPMRLIAADWDGSVYPELLAS